MASTQDDAIAELQRANAELLRELRERDTASAHRGSDFDERAAYQAATIDVLKAMSASPGDPRPVFELIVRQASLLCGSANALLFEYDGSMIDCRFIVSSFMAPEEIEVYLRQYPMPLERDPDHSAAVVVRERRVVHVRDADAEPGVSAAARGTGIRSAITVPLIRSGVVAGALTLADTRPGGYSDSQVELLKTFAEQAVIAITSAETYRALQTRTAELATRNTEYSERIDHQAATIDVLKVMAASPGDAQPVFELIVKQARTQCNSQSAFLFQYDGLLHCPAAVSSVHSDEEMAAYQSHYPRELDPDPESGLTIAIRGGRIAHMRDDESERGISAQSRALGTRSGVVVPMIRDGIAVGCIALGSTVPGGFSDSQIELLKTFAEQAVIAITSAETFRALRDRTAELAERNDAFAERIEHQTATIDVLKEMSSSPGKTQPVFDRIVSQAVRLCDGMFGVLVEYDGTLAHLRAVEGSIPGSVEAYRGQFPMAPTTGTNICRAILERDVVQIRDVDADPSVVAATRAIRHRASVAVPLLRAGDVIGAIGLAAREPGGFSDTQIELLKTFAEQAVIAITSAETYRALQARTAELAERNTAFAERIDHQAATIDVLRSISASPDDARPALETIARRAWALCGEQSAILYRVDGSMIHLVVYHRPNLTAEQHQEVQSFWPRPIAESIMAPAVTERRILHVRDVDAWPRANDRARRFWKSAIWVPMLRGDTVIGIIGIDSQEKGGFSDTQVELLKTFAEQAVIAITSAETYRALQTRTTDLQESLEYQTAISDVLKVISRSTFDLQPVLDTIMETAARICDADMAFIFRRHGDIYKLESNWGFPPEFAAYLKTQALAPGRASITQRTALEGRIIHVHDMAADPEYALPKWEMAGVRTGLGVPLTRDGVMVGVIDLARRGVRPFSERQIELVATFADQAVIAIENTRLLNEQREALERQTATAEVLEVINSSPGDLTPVFEAVLEKALRLCGASIGGIYSYNGRQFEPTAFRGVTPEFAAFDPGKPLTLFPGGILDTILRTRRPVQDPDLMDTDRYRNGNPYTRALVDLGGIRALLDVPLLKDNEVIGVITIFRDQPGAFTDKQIALLENFAAQAVIAMDNARLLTEQREALEQQTATAEVLGVINASPGDLTPVFEAILEKAHRICRFDHGALALFDGTHFRAVATRGYGEAGDAWSRDPYLPSGAQRLVMRGARYGHIPDIAAFTPDPDDTKFTGFVALTGFRATLLVPLRKDGAVIGHISGWRLEPGPFSDKEIALLENFAAQAVIAMENARLLTEQREALEQQTATAEVLQVINASPGDLTPVFDAILEKAHAICGVTMGTLQIYDGDWIRSVAVRGLPPGPVGERVERSLRKGLRKSESKLPVDRVGQITDVAELFAQDPEAPGARLNLDAGVRTQLIVPLLKDGVALGRITAGRLEVRPFTDRQIALLENFAAQAVIAMESARLLNELRARTDELAQRQAELRVTFENMGDGVAMFDETQHLAAWNRKFQDILDVPDEIIARRQTFTEYARYLAERGEFGPDADVDEQVRRLLETGGQLRVFERVRPNGRVIEVRSNPVAGGGFVLIYADITERKRNEAEIAAARDAAEEATRTIEAAFRELKTAQANLIQAEKMASLGQLTAGIAHEIKNPLNFVNNFAELSVDLLAELKEAIAPAEAALNQDQRDEVDDVVATLTGNLKKINEHGKRADGIVKAMLEHSRGASGERRTIDINVLTEEALSLAYHGARAQDQSFNITLEHDFGDGIAPIEVNPQDITRVLLNLFSNGFYAAKKRAESGAEAGFNPTLKVATRAVGDTVEIRVRDNGTGIPPDIRDKLFQPFFTTKPTGEGTGLGLSITYDIVTKAHGGTITVDSEVNEFTEFVVTLPSGMFANEGGRA